MKCPICDKQTTWKENLFRPFCSERCKLIDFGNWADENYSVPSELPPDGIESVERHDASDDDDAHDRARGF